MKRFFNSLYYISRVIIIISPFIILGALVKKDLVLSGSLSFSYDFSGDAPAITNLFPANRLSDVKRLKDAPEFWQEIKQEPVYFTVRLPQSFDTAEVEITYQNQNQPLVQLGLETLGEGEWNYEFKPLENQLLDNLPWFKLEGEDGSLWQREKKFLNWDHFLSELNRLKNLAAYHYPLQRKFILEGYRPQVEDYYLSRALRGGYSFYTYLKNETLDFTFIVQDINRQVGPDSFTVNVYNNEGQKIYSRKETDDGWVTNLDPASKPRTVEVKLAGLPEGVYRLELQAEDEIITRKIRTKQQYLTFIDRLYLADSSEYSDGLLNLDLRPTTIYSTIPRLGFHTAHPEGLQTVGLNERQSLTLDKIHQDYFITPADMPTYIYSPKNDLKIFGRGLMAFSKSMYFNPEIYDLRDLTLTPEVAYLVSQYQTPKKIGEWKINRVKFDLNQAKVVNRKLRFVISSPELNQSGAVIPLKEIKVTLTKRPLTAGEIWPKFIKYLRERF